MGWVGKALKFSANDTNQAAQSLQMGQFIPKIGSHLVPVNSLRQNIDSMKLSEHCNAHLSPHFQNF